MEYRKENRNALRSKRLIREAFFALLKEKELEKITVRLIADRADVNRSTYYAHYQDIQELVDEIGDEI